MKCCCLWY